MDQYNPYVRIQTYYSWLINDSKVVSVEDSYDLGIPLTRLQERTDIPITVIRRDFLSIFQWQNRVARCLQEYPEATRRMVLSFDEENEEYQKADRQCGLDALYEQLMEGEFPQEFEDLLLKGALDSIPIYAADDDIDGGGCPKLYRLSLSQEEAAALRAFYADSREEGGEKRVFREMKTLRNTYRDLYDVKDSYLFTHQYVNLNENLDRINMAIHDGRCLNIKYRTSKGKIQRFSFRPLKIAYDADENLYSVLSVYNNRVCVHRLDHILSIEECDEKMESVNEELLAIYPNVWGNCFSDAPEHVKVRFYNEANVWNKVKKELANRTNGRLYEEDGFLYYEDIVYGISKFRSWIYGYGSSAIVLEPKSLQKQILESLRLRKAQR